MHDRVREIVRGEELVRLLETHRPELVGRHDLVTREEMREAAELELLFERAEARARIEAALAYAARRWPVFALSGKVPRAGSRGFHDATTDAKTIKGWWAEDPTLNVGIRTGRASGLLVLDVDPKHGGDETLAALEAQNGKLPATVEGITGSGGRHVFFRFPDAELRNSAGALGEGLDTRGEGGYVVAPPSVHPDTGRAYEWELSSHPDETPLTEPPGWLLDQLGDRQRGHAPPVGAVIPAGQRDATLASLAGSMRRRGMGEAEILAALRVANEQRCRPPLPDRDVERIAASIGRYQPAVAVPSIPPPGLAQRLGLAPSDLRFVYEGHGTVASIATFTPDESFPPIHRDDPSAERNVVFRTAREIAEMTPAEVAWIARPWVAQGALTEVEGKIKASGKTTWVTHLCRAVVEGAPFMGEPTVQTPVVFLSEQPHASFREALRRADLLEADNFLALSRFDALGIEWAELVAIAVEKCVQVGAKLLVTDTLHPFAGLRGDDENSAGAAQEALEPLQRAAAHRGLAIVINRHGRKSGGDVGDSGRGSSGFGGGVDLLVSIRRRGGTAPKTQRLIETLGRFDETPDSLVIDLTPAGYIALGSEDQAQLEAAKRLVLDALPTRPGDARSQDELAKEDALADVKRTTLQDALRELTASQLIKRGGEGKRGNPYRYHRGSE